MRTILRKSAGAAALCITAMSAQALTPFETDVNAAIDAGLQYARASNHFTVYTEANGLSLLALLQKETIPAGYDGLTRRLPRTALLRAAVFIYLPFLLVLAAYLALRHFG